MSKAYVYLAANLRRYRAESGWSQGELARRAGPPFTQQYVSLLERGLTPAEASDVDTLARVLGVTAPALLRRVRRVQRVVSTAA